MKEKNRIKLNDKSKKIIEIIILILVLIILCTYININNSPIYQTNDDVTMIEIASGQYLGEPCSHLIYILYPVSFILKILYKISNKIDWYYIFMITCEITFWGIVEYKIISKSNSKKIKLLAFASTTALMLYLFYKFLVSITYTEISGFIAICCLIIYVLSDGKKSENLTIITGLTISFSIRPLAMLMIMPIAGPFIIYKCVNNKKIWQITWKLILIQTMILVGVVILNKIMYSSSKWKEYYEYNKYRTLYYDYYENTINELDKDDLNNLLNQSNISSEEYELIKKYAIGLDDELSKKFEILIKNYEKNYKIKLTFKMFWKRVTQVNQTYTNYLIIYAILIIVSLILTIKNKNTRLLLTEIALIIIQLIIYSYLIFKGRVLNRVLILLFVSHITSILICIMYNKSTIKYIKTISDNRIIYPVITMLLIILIPLIIKNNNYNILSKNMIENEKKITDYINANINSYYVVDVKNYNNKLKECTLLNQSSLNSNYISMGDWVCYSDIYYKKLSKLGVNSLAELIEKTDNIKIITSNDKDIELYKDFFNDKNFTLIDNIKLNYKEYSIYELKNNN